MESKPFAILLSILVVCTIVTADYQFSVTIYSYSNPDNKCAVCRDSIFQEFGCCDNHAVKDATECARIPRRCENFLAMCFQQPRLQRNNTLQVPVCSSSFFGTPILQSETETFNPPLNFNDGTVWDVENSQLYITLLDDDFGASFPELVDAFAFNLTAGTRIGRTTLSGQFGLASIELSLSLLCTDGYYGPDCSLLCEQPPCSCQPGFTGEFCETDINECNSVDCSGRGVCIDAVNSYICECASGYIGQDCQGTQSNNELSAAGVAVGVSVSLIALLVVILVAVIIFVWLRSRDTRGGFSIHTEKSEPQIHQNPVFSMENSEKRDFGNIYT